MSLMNARMTFFVAFVVILCYLLPGHAHSEEPVDISTEHDPLPSPVAFVERTPKIHVVTMFSSRYTGALTNNALNMQRLGLPYNSIYALDTLSLSLCISALHSPSTACEHLHAEVSNVETITNKKVSHFQNDLVFNVH